MAVKVLHHSLRLQIEKGFAAFLQRAKRALGRSLNGLVTAWFSVGTGQPLFVVGCEVVVGKRIAFEFWLRGGRVASMSRALFATFAAIGLALPSLFERSAAGAEPLPTPSPRPQASDPCGGPGRLLASANRPTVGFSACAVEKGSAVFELGYQNQVNGTPRNGSVQSQVLQNFLRVGVAPHFEVDIIGPNYEGVRNYAPGTPGAIVHGVADSGVGFKYELPPTRRWTVAFDGLYTGPNGSKDLTAGTGTVTGNLDASFSISPVTSIGTTIAVSSTGSYLPGARSRYGVTTPSFVVTTQVPNYYQFYTEYVFVSKIAPDLGGRAFLDFGVQKLLGSHTEVDVEYGHALSGIPTQQFDYLGTGLVVQLW
jgi:hypothetical protein